MLDLYRFHLRSADNVNSPISLIDIGLVDFFILLIICQVAKSAHGSLFAVHDLGIGI